MTTEIVPFEFQGQQVRTVVDGGETRIVVGDIARILGYRDATNAVRVLRDQHKGYSAVSTPGGVQMVLTTNLAGFNRLVLRSNAANAGDVQDWVTDTVMVSIQKTGSYSAPVEDIGIDLATIRQLNTAVGKLLEHNERMAGELAEVAPRAEAWDALASAHGDYAVGDAAKMLARAGINTGPQRLFEQLRDIKWTFRGEGGKWRAYADRVEKGYLTERPMFHFHPKTGERVVDPPQLRVTIKGLERLRLRLHDGALKAVSA
jgi:anti-repressor protein